MSIERGIVPARFRQTARRFGNHPAVKTATSSVSFSELDQRSDNLAGALRAHGFEFGQRVALYCINGPEFVISYLGILKAGGTVVPLNLLLNPEEIGYMLHDSGAAILIYHAALAQNVLAGRRGSWPELQGICIGPEEVAQKDLLWQPLTEKEASGELPAENALPEVAVILYTSGTTGYPKGAMLTHANLCANVDSVIDAIPLEAGKDSVLTVLPMFHAFAATAGMLYPLFHGCTILPLPKFDPGLVADTAHALNASLFLGVPSMYNMLLRLPDGESHKLQSIKYCVSGGAAMPVSIMDQFDQRFGIAIYEGDGPTECSPVTCVNPIGGTRKPGSVGLPVKDVEMEIRDETGNELPLGEIGEICVRGPNVMKGYWNRPDDTAEAFFGEWFRTGDLGSEDEDGYFYIVDRKKDMVIVNGMNVYPRIIEEVLYKHPAVREAAVIGEPSELHGEIPVAYISLKPGHESDTKELRSFCREHLGRHEIPRAFHIIDDLPKNAAGKIVKRELRRQGELERGIDLQ